MLALRGRWQTDPRHGAQFRPTGAEVRRPSDVDGIVRYLGSGLVRQIGPVLAKRIVGTFGERTLEVLDATPERVREVPGIGPQRAAGHRRGLGRAPRPARGDGVPGRARAGHAFAPRLLAAYGAEAPRILAANPYRLVADVPGPGLPLGRPLGEDLGVRPTAPARLQAAVQAALLRAAEKGHTRLPRPGLVDGGRHRGRGRTRAVPRARIAQLLAGAVPSPCGSAPRYRNAPRTRGMPRPMRPDAAAPRPSRRSEIGRVRVYAPAEPAADRRSVGGGHRRTRASASVWPGWFGPRRIWRRGCSGWRRRPGLPAPPGRVLAGRRRRGARRSRTSSGRPCATAATSGCFVLTGGPGVGKTTTTRALVRCLQALGRSVALAAPTGKAARRLGEVVGLEARTLHRLLGAGPRRLPPRRATTRCRTTCVIVDEASMLDTQLARAVVRAIGPARQLDPGRGRRSASERRPGPGAARRAGQRAGALGAPGDGVSAGGARARS